MRDDIYVVVDSVAVSDETTLKDDPRVRVLPLICRHGSEEWYDGERDLKQLFAMVESTGNLPSTSQPPIGNILELFSDLSRQGKKIIMIAVDSILSGTYQTCCVAAKQVMDEILGADIRVIDGKTAACPLSGMALAVLRGIDAGMNMDELEQLGLDVVRRTETYFTVDTLDYLQKGGRIGAVGALLGSIFGIRPIVHLDEEGRLTVADKCRTRKKTLKRMVEMAAGNAPIEAFFVAHGEAPADAEWLKEQMH